MIFYIYYIPKWRRWSVIEKVKRPVFRLCNDSVFKELFSKVPNALILLVSDVFKIDYKTINENTTVELATELHKTREKHKTFTDKEIIQLTEWKIEEIIKITGLSEEEIVKIKETL